MENKKVFERMSSEEFKTQWPQDWIDFTSYTRILLVANVYDNDYDPEIEILKFIEEKTFLKLAFVEKTREDDWERNLLWIYLHDNSEFKYLNEDFAALSGIGDGFNFQAVDIDNRILQGYTYGDLDSGMYCEIDPEDFDPNSEENQTYYESIDLRLNSSPIKIEE
jgi:hypothetical protein